MRGVLIALLFIGTFMAGSHRDASASSLSISNQGIAAASAAEAAFLSGLASVTTESFEGFVAANPAVKPLSFTTSVGTFSQLIAGTGGACEPTTCTGLSILSAGTTPYSGRYALDGSNWLDSNDSRKLAWTPTSAFPTHVGFYLTDPDDAGGEMRVVAKDGSAVSMSFPDLFGGNLGNGKVFYLSLFDAQGIASLTFFSNDAADGYGIDRFTVTTPVPEPEIYAMLAIGLGVMGFMGRRQKRLHAKFDPLRTGH